MLEFRDHLTKQGLLVADYLGVTDFESKARQHLTQVVRTWTAGAVVPPPAAPVKEGPSATGVSPPDLQGWHQSLSGGSLAVGLDPHSSAAVYNLVAVVSAVLGEKAFVTRTVDRLAIILMELLNNVARHVPESTARVELELQNEGPVLGRRYGAGFRPGLRVAKRAAHAFSPAGRGRARARPLRASCGSPTTCAPWRELRPLIRTGSPARLYDVGLHPLGPVAIRRPDTGPPGV